VKKEEKASQWIPANIPVTSIKLDKMNVRIAWMDDPQMSQSTLIRLFWDNYNIKEIIHSIGNMGFFRHEVPVVVKDDEDGHYIVIEGNRRLAALKILHNPNFEFIQPMQKKALRVLSQKIKNDIEIIPVYIAPSRDACLQLLFLKHASEDHSSWKTLMQAYLYWKYIQDNPGIKLEMAAAHFNTTSSKFNEHVRLYNLFRMIKAMDNLPADVQKIVGDAITIPITTFERIAKNKKVAEYLDLPIDWFFEDEDKTEFFNTAMKNIVISVINKEENSRSLDKAAEIERFFFSYNKVSKPKDSPPPDNVNGAPGTEGVSYPDTQSPPTEPGANPAVPPNPPAVPRETKSIIRTKIPFGLENATALKDIYRELCKLKVEEAPNASVALFRVFLDKATRKFLENHGFKKCPIVNKNGDLLREDPFTDVAFGDCLKFISSSKCDLVSDSVKKALQFFLGLKAKGLEQSKNKISGMNQLIHNHEISYTPEEAKGLWPQLETYVKILLTE
jgi:hypothetical protein